LFTFILQKVVVEEGQEALSKWRRDVRAAMTKAVLVGGTDRP